MYKPFRTAAVLGAGVMGAQIAAHLANAGLKVFLLDLPATEGKRNSLVESLFTRATELEPTPFFTDRIRDRITLGNVEDDWYRLGAVDLVLESVVEDLQVKRDLLARLEAVVHEEAVIATSTSGISIRELARGRSDSFRRRFLGTHFCNPPRYLKLLELVPTADTDPEVLERMKELGRIRLGKEIIVTKDTPYFVGSRCGVYATILNSKPLLSESNYTLDEIDFLLGNAIGFPRSTPFNTADLVGLDTAIENLDHLYEIIDEESREVWRIPDLICQLVDESREVFRVSNLMCQLRERGRLGAKTQRGSYKEVGSQTLVLNPPTREDELPKAIDLGDEVLEIAKIKDVPTRLRALYNEQGRAGAFFRKFLLLTLKYHSRRLEEFAHSPLDIDRGLCWGYAWPLGPFQMWDAIGWETVMADLQASGVRLPEWLEQMEQSGARTFYGDTGEYYHPAKGYLPIDRADDEISLAAIASEPENIFWKKSEAELLNLGDGVALYEFRSPGNLLTEPVIIGLLEAIELVEKGDFSGLVIGNEGKSFCTGLNWQDGELANLEALLQNLGQRIHYASKPIVAAVQGSVLGGGCQLAMACHQIVAAAESYIGLNELGLGLIPGGGGLMRLTASAAQQAAKETCEDILPFLQRAFETVIKVKVSSSAMEAQDMGLLPANSEIVMNAYRRFYVAKKEVIRLAEEGFAPPAMVDKIPVLGKNGRRKLENCAQQLLQQKIITKYDYALAQCLAYVITGGELPDSTRVDEDYLLELEQETFASLLSERKTRERIAHVLSDKQHL